jgi:amino-acid N-acetyltransferase
MKRFHGEGSSLLRVRDRAMPDLQRAGADDLPAILELLEASGLPTTDLHPEGATQFLLLRDGRRLDGVVGLERYGAVGLLRSLAVRPERRRAGLGIALTEALEKLAAASGLTSVVLLTQTAQAFFAERGYRVIARDTVPPAMQSSSQFTSLCPASAICMRKELTPG